MILDQDIKLISRTMRYLEDNDTYLNDMILETMRCLTRGYLLEGLRGTYTEITYLVG